eukprot:scaffold50100_cov36-Cyclotella_meneghiniana.AAC.3
MPEDAELEEKELEDTAIGGGGGGKRQEYNSCVNTADSRRSQLLSDFFPVKTSRFSDRRPSSG